MKGKLIAIAAAGVCVVSVVIHAVLVLQHSDGRETVFGPVAPPVEVATTDADCYTCQDQLAACRTETWSVVFTALERDPYAPNNRLPNTTPLRVDAGAPNEGAGTGTGIEASDETARKAALCQLAEDHLANHFRTKSQSLMTVLAGAGDENQRNAWRGEQLDDMQAVLGWSDADRQNFDQQRYKLAFNRHMEGIFAGSRYDYTRAEGSARALFADEDRLIRETSGEDAMKKWRAAQMNKRTAVLAILSTMARDDLTGATQW